MNPVLFQYLTCSTLFFLEFKEQSVECSLVQESTPKMSNQFRLGNSSSIGGHYTLGALGISFRYILLIFEPSTWERSFLNFD